MALDAAPTVVELESGQPGGGGPRDAGPDGGGGGGGGEPNDEHRAGMNRFALMLALISITTLFATLAIVFILRSRSAMEWQKIRLPMALWLSTGILGLSSFTLEKARHALREHRWFAYRRRLLLTSYLGLAFLTSQLLALGELVRQGVFLPGNAHASTFYIFAGAHGLHLLGGMVALNFLLFRRGRTWEYHSEVSGLVATYWHFLGVTWLFLFALLAIL
jgi:cytochrome c oxidase subunit III